MATTLDPSLYPASYRTPLWIGGLRVLGGIALFLVYMFAHAKIAYGFTLFTILCALIFLLILVNVTFAKVTLYPDRIERITLFGTKMMRRTDVVKLERRHRLIFNTWYLASNKGLFEGVIIPNGIIKDAAWRSWMSGVPVS